MAHLDFGGQIFSSLISVFCSKETASGKILKGIVEYFVETTPISGYDHQLTTQRLSTLTLF